MFQLNDGRISTIDVTPLYLELLISHSKWNTWIILSTLIKIDFRSKIWKETPLIGACSAINEYIIYLCFQRYRFGLNLCYLILKVFALWIRTLRPHGMNYHWLLEALHWDNLKMSESLQKNWAIVFRLYANE